MCRFVPVRSSQKRAWGRESIHALIFVSLLFRISLLYWYSRNALLFCLLFQDFSSSEEMKNPCFLVGFPCVFSRKQGKEDQDVCFGVLGRLVQVGANLDGFGVLCFSELCVLLLSSEESTRCSQPQVPSARFRNLILGQSAGSTKLGRPFRPVFEVGQTPSAFGALQNMLRKQQEETTGHQRNERANDQIKNELLEVQLIWRISRGQKISLPFFSKSLHPKLQEPLHHVQ